MEPYEDCTPRAEAMITSLRAVGYDLSMAIADLIDNSIYAKASNIWIRYGWNDGDPWVTIRDDGVGMSEASLKEAMRLGSKSPAFERDPADLGRFGLGLKTASFSQCRLVVVKSKTDKGEVSTRCWDLDHVREVDRWEISTSPPEGTDQYFLPLEAIDSGTIVYWKKLDKLVDQFEKDEKNAENFFYLKFNQEVKPYLEMVFHRYLRNGKNSISIKVGAATCKPWDPFLEGNDFTQRLSSEQLENDKIRIVPFVLPHVSKRTESETKIGAGVHGWNAHQGFYVYRNKRMIVCGGYLNFSLKTEEHFKLARIMVDIPNEMDHDWQIDIRKAVSIPPDRLRRDLERIAKATRSEAVKIIRARSGNIRKNRPVPKTDDVWKKERLGDKIVYRINRVNPVIKNLLEEQKCTTRWISKLFHTIESTVPFKQIIIDDNDKEDCHVELPEEKVRPSDDMLKLCINFYWNERRKNKSHTEALDTLMTLEPFNTHLAYRAALDSIEESDNEQ